MLAIEPKSYDDIFGSAWHAQGTEIRKRFTYIEVDGAPTVTPEFIGQTAYDPVAKAFYTANGLTSNDWGSVSLEAGVTGLLALATSDSLTLGGLTGRFRSRAHVAASNIDASVDSLTTAFCAPGVLASTKVGGARMRRESLANLAGYPALSYIRSLDRNMPDGAPADDTNGGYWVLDVDQPTPQMFGLISDAAVSDQTAILQAWFDFCGIIVKPAKATVPASIKTTDTVTLPTNVDTDIELISITYTGTKDRNVVYVPSGNTRVYRFGLVQGDVANWSDANYYGIYLRDIINCDVHLRLTRRFTVGYALIGNSANGTAYNRVWPGDIRDCKYNEQLRSLTAGGFINENVFFGGNYGNTSAAALLGVSYGTHVTADPGAYNGHNNNRWIAPNYEMGGSAGVNRIPFFFDGAGGYNTCQNARAEACYGPLVICNGSNVLFNEIGFSFTSTAIPEQLNTIQEVNGANSNRLVGRAGNEVRKTFDNLGRLLSSNGGADGPYVRGEVFIMDSTSGAARRSTTLAGRVQSNALGLEFGSAAAVLTAVDTSRIKQWRLDVAADAAVLPGVIAIAFDAAGTRLTGDAVDVLGNEKYIKNASLGWAASANFGGSYLAASFAGGMFSVRPEVKTMWIGVYGTTIRSFSLVGYATGETLDNTTGLQSIASSVPLDDDGSVPLASANPGTAGTHGYYARGHTVYNSAAATATTPGWTCTTAGWLAAPWAISTAYTKIGRIVTNDTGKMYRLVTAGTSAGAGGPTGTGTAIADGTCVWDYVGVKAVFTAMANLA